MAYTITFDEGAKGFTSFFSYVPEFMMGMNNDFFTVKDGQLYLHNDDDNPTRNNFYGVQYNTKITYVENSFPSEVKFVKSIKLEANRPLQTDIKSFVSDENSSAMESTVLSSEYVEKEGMFYSYVRRNERGGNYSDKNVYGIGEVSDVSGPTVTLATPIPLGSIAAGDNVLDVNGSVLAQIVSYSGSSMVTTPSLVSFPGDFLIGQKDARIEAGNLRGYNFEVTLEDSTTSRLELFGSKLNTSKSNP